MNKDPSDFMLVEYSQTNSGFFHLQDKINDWFKTYIALYGIPFTVLAAVVGISDTVGSLDLFDLPAIVAFLLAVIALLGFFVAMTIVNMRMEMVLYKRAVNDVRRYFAEIDTIGDRCILQICKLRITGHYSVEWPEFGTYYPKT